MKRKSLSQVLGEVDPHLTVIPGGNHGHGHGKRKAVKLSENLTPEVSQYEPQKLTTEDWEKAGGSRCSCCGQEMTRFIRGICFVCARKAEERTDQEIEMEYLSRSLRKQRAVNRR